ncbi:helix-turn-helix domain-containing protein [Brucella anthropi]|uniref:Helix-turn-helix domain-containing protein n=1 Tax=Brucella anthropi TaxID=529 RepID=A0A6L3Z7P2_BRUAN|nr:MULTISPECIES: helix-turn-helix domain-containing protein [Pseudomonadota]KAB2770942.1 helix-turn-helix domain-containing protein [Brucella anthropi]KAB2774487.1 helix-turn-helix domain-containing protein [Brucella anthropi]
MNNETSISTDTIEDKLRNAFWRAVLKPVYEITGEDDDYQFSGSIVARSIGSIQIGATSFNSQNYSRAPKLIAQGGLNQYILQLITGGDLHGDFNGVDVKAKQGDIVIIDLTQTVESRASGGSRITVMIPRDELEKIVGWRNLHGLVMLADAPMTRLLFNYLRSLQSLNGDLDRIEAQSAQDAMFILLGATINGTEGGAVEALPANLPMRKHILAYINENLSNPSLGPHLIIKSLRISRSRLYRALDMDGGVARIIRDKRLDRAYRILVDERGRHVSLKEIAYRCGFHDGTQFTKAFKVRFGMSPKDARESDAALLSSDSANFDYTIHVSEEAAKRSVDKP